MENIHFGTMTMVGFGVAGVLMILLPVVLLVILKKRTHASVMPTVVGAITFVLVASGMVSTVAFEGILLAMDAAVLIAAFLLVYKPMPEVVTE